LEVVAALTDDWKQLERVNHHLKWMLPIFFSFFKIEISDASIQQTVEESQDEIRVDISWLVSSVRLDETVQQLMSLCAEQANRVSNSVLVPVSPSGHSELCLSSSDSANNLH